MDIVSYLESIGIQLKSCGNNEFMGACPFCGGEDRFRVWVDEGKESLGRWACRQGLGKHPGFTGNKEFAYTGDFIGLLMELEGKTYQEAKEILGLDDLSFTPRRTYQAKQENLFSEDKPKNEAWIKQARALAENASTNLFNDDSTMWEGGSCLKWLQEKRCLTQATIKRFKLGLITEYINQDFKDWGLEPYTDKTGKTVDKLNFYRQNLIIPTWRRGGYIDRIKIRFPKPTANNQRFTTLRGSNDTPSPYGKPSKIYVVVESELDAILTAQECPDVCPICLGGAGKHPTKDLAEEIKQGDICFLCLDSDKPGQDKLGYWLDNFKNARPLRIPQEYGKDLTELQLNHKEGKSPVDVSMFIEMGLKLADKEKEQQPQAKEKADVVEDKTPEIVERETEILERAVRLADKMSEKEQDYFKSLLDEVEQAEKMNTQYLSSVLKEIEDLSNKIERNLKR